MEKYLRLLCKNQPMIRIRKNKEYFYNISTHCMIDAKTLHVVPDVFHNLSDIELYTEETSWFPYSDLPHVAMAATTCSWLVGYGRIGYLIWTQPTMKHAISIVNSTPETLLVKDVIIVGNKKTFEASTFCIETIVQMSPLTYALTLHQHEHVLYFIRGQWWMNHTRISFVMKETEEVLHQKHTSEKELFDKMKKQYDVICDISSI